MHVAIASLARSAAANCCPNITSSVRLSALCGDGGNNEPCAAVAVAANNVAIMAGGLVPPILFLATEQSDITTFKPGFGSG